MTQSIGIQGGKASYHEQAALRLHPDGDIRYYGTFRELFAALKSGEVHSIVCAVSNTSIGPIPESSSELEALGSAYRTLHEVSLPIAHSLLGLPGATLEDIQTIYSQKPALDQCEKSLARLLPDARLIETEDTALSAKLVAKTGDRSKASIASVAAGELYGLMPLVAGIQDDPENITNFIEIELITSGALI